MYDRGHIHLASFGAESHPVLIVSRQGMNKSGDVLLVVPGVPKSFIERDDSYQWVVVVPREGTQLEQDYAFLCTHIQVMATARVGNFLGELTPGIVGKLNSSLRIVLDL
jgi:mRNA-degrading endonuclease toxin of MazEF toxin-antitoxin module